MPIELPVVDPEQELARQMERAEEEAPHPAEIEMEMEVKAEHAAAAGGPAWHAGNHPKRRKTDTAHSLLAGQVVIAVAVVLALCYVAKLLLVTVFVSILIAFILAPLVGALEMARVPRPVGAFIAVVGLGAVLYLGLYLGYNRFVSFLDDLPKYEQRFKGVVMRFKERAHRIQETTEQVTGTADDTKTVKVQQQVNLGDIVTSNLSAVTEVILLLTFIPFLVYFMLTWQDHVRAATVMLFKMENRNAAYVTLGRISAMIHSFIHGNLVVGAFTSLVSMVVFAVLGLPHPYVLGFFSGYLSLVPYLGIVLAMFPPLIASLDVLHGAGMLGIVLTVLFLHLFSLNVLYPTLIGKRLQLNPLAVTLGLLIWGRLWGAMGLILAIPLTAAMKIIFDHVESLKPYGAWLGE